MPETPPDDLAPKPLIKKAIYARSFTVFVLLCLLGSWIVSVDAFKHIETQKASALKLAGAQVTALTQRLNEAISLTYTLEVILSENHYQIQPDQFAALGAQLMKAQPAVSSLQYAPDGVVSHVIPLRGNEAIIGHNLFSDPKRNKEAFDAVEKHQLTVAGPFELIQGGVALVARNPIFKTTTGEPFWGFATVLVRIPELLKASDINKLSSLGFIWALWRVHPDTGAVHSFAGSAEALNEHAIQLPIEVPNATWHLSILPRDGWLTGHTGRMALEIVVFLIIAGVGAGLTFLLLRQPLQLQQLVELRTEELRTTNTKLRDSEHRYRSLVENTDDLITRVDREGRLLYVNAASIKYWGLPPEECLGRPAFDFIHPDDREETLRHFQAWLKSKAGFITFVNRQLHSSGTATHMQWLIASLRDIRGNVIELSSTARDLTQILQGEEALRQSEERFRLLFETNPDPVILAHYEDGAIIDVNKAFETLTGASRREALGRNSVELGLWDEVGQRDRFLEQLKADGAIDNLEADFRIRDQGVRTGLVSARVLTIDHERCLLITVRDITTEKRAERALIEMDRMKNEFISAATHELNTPLSAMMGYTEFLLDPEEFGGFSDDQKHDFLTEIYERGEALSRIIDDLLDISRLESGHSIALNLQEGRIEDVLDRSVAFYRRHQPGHQFLLDLPPTTAPAMVLLDRHRMTQVLENLLSNAVKYSAKGTEVQVSGRLMPDGWEIRVADRGIGMTAEQVAKVFDKFYRADASDTAVGGLGLGMSIARQIVDAHGGSIQVESTKGHGTTVSFTLPFASTIREPTTA